MPRERDVIRRGGLAHAAAAVLIASALAGCTTDHDALARQPNQGGGGSGGSAGSGGGGPTGGGNEPSMGGRVNPDLEPPGDDVLTIVNGVVDAKSVRLCFARVTDDGQTSELEGEPLPELAYAATSVMSEIEGFSAADDAIMPWVIAGDLSRIDGLDCQAAVELAEREEAKVTPDPDQEPPADLEQPVLRARGLAALPAGTFAVGRSVLLALSGCMGGAAYGDEIQNEICGDDYAPDAPTLQPIVVKLSREHRFDKIGLQGLHASVPTESLDLRVSGDSGRTSLVFASAVVLGAIEPRPADLRFTPTQLGVDDGGYGLQAVGEDGNVVTDESWFDVLSASGLEAMTIDRTYTAVFVGPSPRTDKRGWWNRAAFSLVDNDPTRH